MWGQPRSGDDTSIREHTGNLLLSTLTMYVAVGGPLKLQEDKWRWMDERMDRGQLQLQHLQSIGREAALHHHAHRSRRFIWQILVGGVHAADCQRRNKIWHGSSQFYICMPRLRFALSGGAALFLHVPSVPCRSALQLSTTFSRWSQLTLNTALYLCVHLSK